MRVFAAVVWQYRVLSVRLHTMVDWVCRLIAPMLQWLLKSTELINSYQLASKVTAFASCGQHQNKITIICIRKRWNEEKIYLIYFLLFVGQLFWPESAANGLYFWTSIQFSRLQSRRKNQPKWCVIHYPSALKHEMLYGNREKGQKNDKRASSKSSWKNFRQQHSLINAPLSFN